MLQKIRPLFLLVSEHQHKGLSLLGRDERASRDDDDPLSPTPERKKSDKEERGRERERDFSWRGLSSLALLFAIKDGETIKNWFSLSGGGVFCSRVFSTHQHGIFPITNGNTEREREDEENTSCVEE